MLAVNARRFRPAARVALFLAARGRCAACGEPLRPGWHADHVRAGERRRRDRAGERAGAVPALQPREGRAAGVIAPRPWQAEFLARHAAHARPDFLLVATPGRGQDARRVPGDPRGGRRAGRRRVPDDRAARAVGGRRGRASGCTSTRAGATRTAPGATDVDGVVVTYQQVASGAGPVRPPPRAADVRGARRDPPRGRVGDLGHRAARRVRRRAPPARAVRARRFAPTRGRSRSCATTRSAAARPTSSTATARRSATTSAGRSRSGCSTRRCAGAWTRRRRSRRSPTSSTRPTTRAGCGRRSTRRTPLLPQMLRDADALLIKARAVIPDAAGLVLCDDRAHARATARAAAHDRRREAGRGGQRRAAGARADRPLRAAATPSAPRWLVAVNMVSEGVDVPRLVLAAYATVKRTDLFFRQAVGRVVRRRADDPGDLVATVFLPADPTLTGCAERVEVELRQQVSDEVGAAFDVEPPPGLARRPDFQPLDAQVEPGGMIVAGVHYARAEVDAARRLLRELGQSERALRSVLEFVRRERVGGAASAADARARAPPRRAQAPRARPPRPPLGAAAARDRPELHVAAGAGARQPRDGRAPPRRRRRGRARRRPGVPAQRARQARPRLPRAGRAAAHPGSVEGIDSRLGTATGDVPPR